MYLNLIDLTYLRCFRFTCILQNYGVFSRNYTNNNDDGNIYDDNFDDSVDPCVNIGDP